MLRLAVFAFLALPASAQSSNYAETSAKCVPSFKEAIVPREEKRQQILEGFHEYRYTYSFANVPPETDLFAECYSDGRMTHRFQLTSAMHWSLPQYAQGTLSVSWNFLRHDLTVINDNGFGLWNSRIPVSDDILNEPLAVVGTEQPHPELRSTSNNYPSKQVTIYPLIALIGAPTGNKLARKTYFYLTSTAGVLSQAKSYQSKQCVIIYMFCNGPGGGNPPFKFANKTDFYINSLPMN